MDRKAEKMFFVFFLNDTATTEIYTLSLHAALPIFPRLWRSELRNVLSLYVRHRSLPSDVALDCMKEAEGILGDRDYEVTSEMVLALTERHPVSAYDAEYVSLAVDLGVSLMTDDEKILKEFEGIAISSEDFV